MEATPSWTPNALLDLKSGSGVTLMAEENKTIVLKEKDKNKLLLGS